MHNDKHHEKLNAQLGAMEQQLKKIRFWRAAGMTLVLFLIALSVAALMDYLIPLTFTQRLVLSVAVYGSALAYAIFGWLLPYRRPMKPENVAWVLEDLEPTFEEKLISAVELSGEQDSKISHEMINRVLQDAEFDLSKHNPKRTFPLSAKTFALPISAALLFIALLFTPSLQFGRLVTRVAFPSDTQATVGAFRLIVHAPATSKKAEADTIEFEVECTDGSVSDIDLIMEDDRTRRFAMHFDETRKRYIFSHADTRQSFRFWAQSGRVQSPKYEVAIVKRPKIKDFTITYTAPEYTGIPSSTTTLSTGALKGYPGTKAKVTIQSTKPLKAVTMDWLGEEQALVVDQTGTGTSFEVDLQKSGDYRLAITDTDDLENLNTIAFPVVVLEDKAPTVKIEQPGGDVHLGLEDRLPIQWTADDDFGITKQELVFTSPGKDPVSIILNTDSRTYDWKLSDTGLQTGDELSYRLRVTDAVGHTSESANRYLSLLKDLALEDAAAFRNIARSLRGVLTQIDKRLTTIEALSLKLKAGNGGAGAGAAGEDIAHNTNMMTRHAQWISDRIAESEKLAHDLQQRSFFPRARICSELMARYFRQERLFSTVKLTSGNAPVALEAIADLRDLNQRMTDALQTKAGEHVPAIQVRRMARTARSLNGNAEELEKRLAARAAKIAEQHHKPSLKALKNPQGIADKLNALQIVLDKKANDYTALDKLANEIRERLLSREEQMAALARQLELFNRAQDWASVQEMKNALEEEANQTDDLTKQADLELAANVLDKAIDEEDQDRVEEVLNRLPEMNRQHELDALREEIAATREQTEEAMDALRKELAEQDGPIASPEDLDVLSHEIDQLQETPLAGKKLSDDNEGRRINDQLMAAENHLRALEQALEQGDEKRAQQEMHNIETRLNYAQDQVDEFNEEGEAELAQNRAALENLAESFAEQLDSIAEALQPNSPEGHLEAEQVKQTSEQIQDLAAEMQRDAQREIQNPEGDVKAARNQMAMAENLQRLNQQQLQPAANAVEQAQQTPEELSAAQNELQAALAELAESQELMQRLEQSENSELPLSAELETEQEIETLAEETLPENLIESLETLEQLRASGEEAEQMAEALDGKKPEAQSIAEAVEDLRQDLGHALMMEGRDAFMDEAEEVIAEAQRGTEDLLTEARALRAELRQADDLNTEEKAELTEEMQAVAEQAKELGIQLARADAVQELLQPETGTALEPLQQEVVPGLEQAVRQMQQAERAAEDARAAPQEGQPAMTPEQIAAKEQQAERALATAEQQMEKAIEGAKEAQSSLEQFAEEMPTALSQPRQVATEINTPATIPAEAMEPAIDHLARMQDYLAEAQAAQAGAEMMREEMLPEIRNAAELMEAIPEEFIDKNAEQQAKKALADFSGEDDPGNMANQMLAASQAMRKEDPELARELQNGSQQMRKLGQKDFAAMEQIERRSEERVDQTSNEARSMQSDLAKLESPEAEAAIDALEQMRQNLANRDLERAEANLEAVEANLAELAKKAAEPQEAHEPATLPVNNPTPQNQPPLDPQALVEQHPALKQAANPEANWHERKGLMEAAAEALNHAEPSLNAAELAAEGELDAAAKDASLAAVDHFEKAAELMEALQEPEAPSEFVSTPEANELAKQFENDPEKFIDDTADKVDEAREAAETVTDAIRAGQRPSEPAMEKLEQTVAEAEAMRAQLGEAQYPAKAALENEVQESLAPDQPNLLEAGEGMEDVEQALAMYADELAQAAVDPDTIAADAETPETFSKPREMLSAQEEAKLAAQASDDRESLIGDAQKQLADAQKAATAVEQDLKKGQTPAEEKLAALAEAVTEVEAMRDALGEDSFEAHQSMEALMEAGLKEDQIAKEAKEGIQELKNQLAQYDPLLKAEMERQKAFNSLKELAEEVEQAAGEEAFDEKKAQQAANELSKALEKRKGLASQQAAEAVQQVEEALKGDAKPETETVSKAAEEMARAVDALNPANELEVTPNREAFDAAAKADALENEDALNKALAGDYEAAAESMKALSEALPDSPQKAQAEKAAKEFSAAREEQMEALPTELANALEDAEAINEELPAAAANALEEAADAARAGNLPQASERLQEAIADAKKPDSKEALAKLDEELNDAAKAANEQLAGLSDAAKEALEHIESLAENADPVTQTALEEAANDLKGENFEDAAENVAKAAFGMDKEGLEKASKLAKDLQDEEKETYGDASEPGREGIKALGEEHAAIAEAAKAEDYQAAEELAQAAGEKAAADAFKAAKDQQQAALPSAAQQGLQEIEEAMKKAGDQERELLEQAEKAARQGDFAEAAALARQATTGHEDQIALAEQLDDAQQYADDTIQPLKEAVKDANQNQMARAAQHAAQSPAGQEAAESLQSADDEATDAVKDAFQKAFSADNRSAQQKLESAARQAQNNNFDQAVQEAKRAGNEGREAAEKFQQAQQANAEAKDALNDALQKAEDNNTAAQQAKEGLASAQQAATEQARSAADHQAQTRQAQQALQQAAQALQQNKPERAAEMAAKAAPENTALQDQLKALTPESSQEARQAAGEALQQAAESANEQAQQAQQQQQQAQTALNDLNQAQQRMQQGQLGMAADEVKQAAQGAVEANQAAEAFAKAAAQNPSSAPTPETEQRMAQQTQSPSANEQPTQPSGQNTPPGSPAESASTPGQNPQSAQQAQPGQQPGQNPQSAQQAQPGQQPGQNPQSAQQAQPGQQPGQNAPPGSPAQAQASSQAPGQAQGSPQSASPSQGTPPPPGANTELPMQAQNQSDSIPLPAQEVSQAMIDLQAAQTDLQDGRPTPYTADNLQNAAHALQQASAAMAQTVLGQVNNQVGAPQQPPPGQASQGSPQGGEGGPQGNRTPQQQAAAIPDLKENFKSPQWVGVRDRLKNDNSTQRKVQYDEYYRKANRQYLEKLMKETKK